jgi:peroxiredoxin Q/BCP
LQKGLKSLEDKQIRVVAISYDPVEVLAKFAEKHKITFPLLSDPDSKVIKDYGLLNKEAKGKTEGIPYPGTVLIDRDGVIRAKLFFDGYRERHAAEDILKAAAEIK